MGGRKDAKNVRGSGRREGVTKAWWMGTLGMGHNTGHNPRDHDQRPAGMRGHACGRVDLCEWSFRCLSSPQLLRKAFPSTAAVGGGAYSSCISLHTSPLATCHNYSNLHYVHALPCVFFRELSLVLVVVLVGGARGWRLWWWSTGSSYLVENVTRIPVGRRMLVSPLSNTASMRFWTAASEVQPS